MAVSTNAAKFLNGCGVELTAIATKALATVAAVALLGAVALLSAVADLLLAETLAMAEAETSTKAEAALAKAEAALAKRLTVALLLAVRDALDAVVIIRNSLTVGSAGAIDIVAVAVATEATKTLD